MPEMHLRQPRFTYSACGLFTKNKERTQKFKETGDSRYIYQNELDKVCFQQGMAYADFKDLTRRTASDKILCDKAFNIFKNQNMMDINMDLRQWSIHFLIKQYPVEQSKMKLCLMENQLKNYKNQLLENLKTQKVYSFFIDNNSGTDLRDMQLISKFNKGFRFLLCVIDVYSKYAWDISLKDKKGIIITNGFQKILDESKGKPNKIQVNKGSKF